MARGRARTRPPVADGVVVSLVSGNVLLGLVSQSMNIGLIVLLTNNDVEDWCDGLA